MTKAEISAFMREMGRKGGLVGGKRALETMTPAERSARASHAARARWAKRTSKVQTSSTTHWSPDLWPVGTTFEIYFDDGALWTNCVLSRYTPTCVFWFKPEYDGANRKSRRYLLDNFKADIASGKIRVPRETRYP